MLFLGDLGISWVVLECTEGPSSALSGTQALRFADYFVFYSCIFFFANAVPFKGRKKSEPRDLVS